MFSKHNTIYSAVILLIVGCCAGQVRADATLHSIFTDNMVLQRNQNIKVWGWADPNESISVSISSNMGETSAAADGKWMIELPPLTAGGPYDLTVNASNNITLHNVLIGDVWLCSGQSNMQWNIQQTGFEDRDTAFLSANQVRMFTVPIEWDCLPKENFTGGNWANLSSDNIQFFSAVAYHFGKELHHETGVPIGLINSSLGATSIETWMSHEALLEFPQFRPDIEPAIERNRNFSEMEADFAEIEDQWKDEWYERGPGFDERWYQPAVSTEEWKEMAIPKFWEEIPGLEEHDGAVWFRKEFDLPSGFDGESLSIHLNQIDDYDITWVNGERIGETYGRHTHRNYEIDADLLKEKGNVIVCRVFDVGGFGGFTTNAFWGNAILNGTWKYKVGQSIDPENFVQVVMPNASPFSSPGVLYNANIAPIKELPLTGMIWYQGESNASRADEYRQLLPALVLDWRKKWGMGPLPFVIVQLANYTAPLDEPAESDWAELREAQYAATELENVGIACAIDIGEAGDIHPKNKQEVGRRLMLNALHTAYGEKVEYSGPTVGKAKFGKSITIDFDHVGAGLTTSDGGSVVHGFAIAGEDQKFVFTAGKVTGKKKVTLEVPDGMKVEAVRYAWATNPHKANLVNSANLPAFPFRTDAWPGVTKGQYYDSSHPRF